MTGASPYRVRVALAELANQETSSGADVTSTGENDAGDAPDRQDNAEHAIAATAPLTVVDPPADAEAPKPTEALRQPAAVVAPAPAGGGRFVAWAGFVFGSVMSVAANVLHTWLPADRLPQGWAPGIAAQVGAAVWPIGLLLSVEVLSRVPWRPGWQWGLARFGGTGTVALGSAVISYGYVRDVLAAWGYDPVAAHVGPLVLDGLMVISGFALLTMSPARTAARTHDSSAVPARSRGDGAVGRDGHPVVGPIGLLGSEFFASSMSIHHTDPGALAFTTLTT